MKHSDSIAKIAPALVAAQADLKAIGKDAVNPHFKNRYASLDAIVEAVRPVLAKHGIAVMQGVPSTTRDETGKIMAFAVETMVIHVSGEWITSGVIMPLAKHDPQGAGGALTYGRRYSLSALLALATDDDDDGNSNGVPPKQQTARTPQAGRVQDAITPSASDEMVRVAADKDVELTPDVGWIIKGAALDDMDAKDIKVVKAVAQKRGYPSLVKACDKLLAEIALR